MDEITFGGVENNLSLLAQWAITRDFKPRIFRAEPSVYALCRSFCVGFHKARIAFRSANSLSFIFSCSSAPFMGTDWTLFAARRWLASLEIQPMGALCLLQSTMVR